MTFDPTDVDAFRWHLWEQVFGFRLMPPKERLDALIVASARSGRTLWTEEARPVLGAGFEDAFEPGSPTYVRAADLRRVGAAAHAFAATLCRAHGADAAHAHDAGVIAMWLAQAAAVMDFLLDAGQTPRERLAALVRRPVVRAALSSEPDGPDGHFGVRTAPPELLFLVLCLEEGFARLRRRFAEAQPEDPYQQRLAAEIAGCLDGMIDAELASTTLRLDGPIGLDAVEAELRQINTLGVWMWLYVGLVGRARPAERLLEGLRRVAARIGDVGWTLDALSDVHEDLAAGVWSRVWWALEVEDGAAWRGTLPVEPRPALEALLRSSALDRLLAGVEVAIHEIETEPTLPVAEREQLGLLCRLQVWSFLVPAPRGDGATTGRAAATARGDDAR